MALIFAITSGYFLALRASCASVKSLASLPLTLGASAAMAWPDRVSSAATDTAPINLRIMLILMRRYLLIPFGPWPPALSILEQWSPHGFHAVDIFKRACAL